eukprot:NODE_1793_length_2372_cov_4.272606.p1 GENE.NODE_1793_length_2372_cov_4.272606~~NODE_1793_length_2372_cov_4.272606.p1  ORF type:complete len:351 (+),score=90.05 NODE_1793_length_2372_cov_4.272606:169-1221(+)
MEEPPSAAIPFPLFELEGALQVAGPFGRAQWCVLAITGSAWILNAIGFAIPIFVVREPVRVATRCDAATPHGGVGSGASCVVGLELGASDGCGPEGGFAAWRYRNPENYVSAEWDLICDERMLRASVASLFFLGTLFSNGVLGSVPDRIGRCRTFAAGAWAATVAAALCAGAPTFNTFLAGRFFVGLSFGSLANVAYISAMEVVGKEYTTTVMMLMSLMWAQGLVLSAALAHALPAWRVLSAAHALALAGIGAIALLALWYGLESPAWLLSTGQQHRFWSVLDLMARVNGRDSPSHCLLGATEASSSPSPRVRWAITASPWAPATSPATCTHQPSFLAFWRCQASSARCT